MVLCYRSKRELIQQLGRNLNGGSSGKTGASARPFMVLRSSCNGNGLHYPSLGSMAELTLIPPSFLCSSKESHLFFLYLSPFLWDGFPLLCSAVNSLFGGQNLTAGLWLNKGRGLHGVQLKSLCFGGGGGQPQA